MPNVSTTLPLGIPPMPKAKSNEIDPVEMAPVSERLFISPSLITVPDPNWRSICPIAISSAFVFSVAIVPNLTDEYVFLYNTKTLVLSDGHHNTMPLVSQGYTINCDWYEFCIKRARIKRTPMIRVSQTIVWIITKTLSGSNH